MAYQDPYAPQDVYAQQQQSGVSDSPGMLAGVPYAQPGAYPPQQPYGQPGVYPPPGAYPPYGQPAAYPPPQQPYGQPGTYPSYGQPNYVQGNMRAGNPWASRALYSGIISIILAMITFVSTYGFAGVITGSFAIYRGIVALNYANKVPGKPRRVQAIIAIALGIVAWMLVLSKLILYGFS